LTVAAQYHAALYEQAPAKQPIFNQNRLTNPTPCHPDLLVYRPRFIELVKTIHLEILMPTAMMTSASGLARRGMRWI
jgi:hypothetical protein